MLDLAGISMYAKDRDMGFPLLVCGGPCAFNVETLLQISLILCPSVNPKNGAMNLSTSIKLKKSKGFPGGKEAFLRKVAQILVPYCPLALYDVSIQSKAILNLLPRFEEVPVGLFRETYRRGRRTCIFYPTKPVVPFLDIVHDRAVLELFRGCTRGCRFCQAGMFYRPVR